MRSRSPWWIALLLIGLGTACGDCRDTTVNGGDSDLDAESDGTVDIFDGASDSESDGHSSADSESPTDGDAAPNDGAADAGPCGARRSYCGGETGSCVDLSTDRNHCGTCGNRCSGKRVCVSGSCQCPTYFADCGGTCVATNLDGSNCGGCGNTCTGETACAGGRCEEECPKSMTKCGASCFDLKSNDQHCGSCNDPCPSGEVCTHGNCAPPISVGSPPAKCRGGGPPIQVGFGGGRGRKCTGRVAKTTFRWAICSCDDLTFRNSVLTDAYDSTLGPYVRGGYGGGLGTNGELFTKNDATIFGSIWTSSSKGWSTGNKARVKQQLHSGGDVTLVNETHVRGASFVDGSVRGQGPTTFHSTLHLPTGQTVSGGTTTPGGIARQNVNVSKVCSRCQPGNRIPVDSIVRNHRPPNNDNGLINLDPNALRNPGKEPVLVLPCGKYYLKGATVEDKLTIVATGRTALLIDGDFDVKSEVVIKPKPSATLDVFVAGDVDIGNKVWLGSPAYPASTRFYVGGSNGWLQRNKGTIGAYIYAVPGGIRALNKFFVYGGVYVQNLDAKNDVQVHFDRQILSAGKNCPSPGGGGGSNPDAGGDTAVGGDADVSTDADGGGGGGSCSEKGDSCGTDADCCSPLVCDGGTCSATSCINLYESCSSNSDCCSGTCGTSGGKSYCVSG